MLTSPTRPLWCSPGVVVPLLNLIGGIVNARGDGSRDFDLTHIMLFMLMMLMLMLIRLMMMTLWMLEETALATSTWHTFTKYWSQCLLGDCVLRVAKNFQPWTGSLQLELVSQPVSVQWGGFHFSQRRWSSYLPQAIWMKLISNIW